MTRERPDNGRRGGGATEGTDVATANRRARRSLGRRGVVAVTTLGIVATGATMAGAEIITPNPETLKAVGPTSGVHGFPVWYEDGDGLRLEQCLDATDAYCDPAFLTAEGLDPSRPLHIGASAAESNFPGESFYFQAGNSFDTPSGPAVDFVAALEATFANEAAKEGDQVVFGRLRIRIDDAVPFATYTVTHPYGVDTVTADDRGRARFVEDITPAPDNFGLALGSRIAPFLVDAAGMHEVNGNSYVGNPAVETQVTGSPHDTDYVEVSGPGIDTFRDDTFAILGKVAVNQGIEPLGVYEVDTAGQDYIDVYAAAGRNSTVEVSGDGVAATSLTGDGAGNFFARIPVDAFPASVTVSNTSDVPAEDKDVPVTDRIQVTGAVFDDGTLTVEATSSDSDAALSVEGFGAMTDGTLTATGLAMPPHTVTVVATEGGAEDGRTTAPVMVTGSDAGEAVPQAGNIAGLPPTVAMGQTVTLDASSSTNVDSFAWAASAGTIVADAGNPALATFTAPGTPGTVTITLTTQGPEGERVFTRSVEVQGGEVPTAVTVTADDPTPEVGAPVVLTATGTNATSYEWVQTSTPAVSVPSTTGNTVSFTAPAHPVTFQVTATGPGGTATGSVTVTPNVDTLAITAAELRTGTREWRVSGTSSVTDLNTVTVFLATTTGTKGAVIGTATVDATGAWTVRIANGVSPTTGFTRVVAESTKGGVSAPFAFTSRR
ncbi:hypothetical protein ACI78V_19200 [Geodermatophilus sp. SYSU D00742]